MTGTVTGQMLGMPGNGRRITFRTLHVFEFRAGRISRENVWIDDAAVAAQLTAPPDGTDRRTTTMSTLWGSRSRLSA